METSDVVMDIAGVGALLVGIVTLLVAVLTLRSARSVVQLAEARNEYLLHEEQTRLGHLRRQHKMLEEELLRERQERLSVQEELNQVHGELLEAQQRAEQAEQESLKQATQQLRERMDRYILRICLDQELEEGIQPGSMRRKSNRASHHSIHNL